MSTFVPGTEDAKATQVNLMTQSAHTRATRAGTMGRMPDRCTGPNP
jgi:hypothetical protein